MNRIVVALGLVLWMFGLEYISYGFEESSYFIEGLICSFSLPLWSITSIGLWYDTGRLLFSQTFSMDSQESTVPLWIRSLVFTFWMSMVFTYVIWVHINLQAIPLMVVIPLLGIPMRNLLLRDWSVFSLPTIEQITAISLWVFLSYLTYWVLAIAWILIRVYTMDLSGDGFVYIIQ